MLYIWTRGGENIFYLTKVAKLILRRHLRGLYRYAHGKKHLKTQFVSGLLHGPQKRCRVLQRRRSVLREGLQEELRPALLKVQGIHPGGERRRDMQYP